MYCELGVKIIFFYKWIPVDLAAINKNNFYFLMALHCPSCHKSSDYVCVGLFLDSLLFHWSVYLSLCQYHIVLIIAISYVLKYGIIYPPALFFSGWFCLFLGLCVSMYVLGFWLVVYWLYRLIWKQFKSLEYWVF